MILTILKVIGIALLCILVFALFVVLLVLFVPIRYEVNADIKAPSSEDEALSARTQAKAGFSWLLHLVRGHFVWPMGESGAFGVYVAFFRIFPGKGAPKRGKDRKSARRGKTADGREQDGEPVPAEADGAEAAGETETADSAEAAGGTETADSAGAVRRERTPLSARIGRIRRTLTELSEKPQFAAEKWYYTICGIYDKIKKICATMESAVWSRAKQLLFNEVRRIARHVVPRRCAVHLVYGADDPKKTADVAAFAGMLYPVFEERVRIVPVFDEETLYGTARVKGRIMLIVPLCSFLRCFFSRDVRRILKRFRVIRNGERRTDGG